MLKNKITALALMLLPVISVFAQVNEGDVAPDFNGTLVNGKYFSLHETVADSIVVLFFMGYN